GRLRRAARAAGDVSSGDRDRRVAVDGVLVALRESGSPLVGLRLLDPELEAACSPATGVAAVLAVPTALAVTTTAAFTDVLGQRLVLIGLRLVRDVGVGRGRCRL